jgi:hypothetical protein
MTQAWAWAWAWAWALATALGCLLPLAATATAATVEPASALADPLDNSGGGARAAAMGSAFVGVADDSTALLWNPGGLGDLSNAEISLNHNSWLGGIVQEIGIGAVPLGGLGVLGVAVSYVNYGSLQGYDDVGNQTANYSPYSYGFDVGWGKMLLDHFSVGLALKASLEDIDGYNYDSDAVDLGALWEPLPHLRIGLTGANLGPSVAGFSLPATIRTGASYRFDLSSNNQLLLAVAGAWEPQGVNFLQFGAEDRILPLLAFRVGYQASLQDTEITGLSGLSLGLGVTLQRFDLDYAFLPYGDLGNGQRISLSYQFD